MLRIALLASAIAASASGAVVSLNADNFDSVVANSGKNAFVKFLAPW